MSAQGQASGTAGGEGSRAGAGAEKETRAGGCRGGRCSRIEIGQGESPRGGGRGSVRRKGTGPRNHPRTGPGPHGGLGHGCVRSTSRQRDRRACIPAGTERGSARGPAAGGPADRGPTCLGRACGSPCRGRGICGGTQVGGARAGREEPRSDSGAETHGRGCGWGRCRGGRGGLGAIRRAVFGRWGGSSYGSRPYICRGGEGPRPGWQAQGPSWPGGGRIRSVAQVDGARGEQSRLQRDATGAEAHGRGRGWRRRRGWRRWLSVVGCVVFGKWGGSSHGSRLHLGRGGGGSRPGWQAQAHRRPARPGRWRACSHVGRQSPHGSCNL